MPGKSIDAIDRKIAQALQDNGRMSNAELAERVALSPSPCLRRVRQLEREGVITGYRAALDSARLGWEILGFVTINIEQHGPDGVARFNEAVVRTARVLSCHALAGADDYLLQVIARDLDDYFDLMQRLGNLPGVKDIRSSIAIKEIKAFTGIPATFT